MYERSAIVLERYFEKIFGLNKENNLKTNYNNYDKIVKIIKKYKQATDEEEKVMSKFDEVATRIEEIQEKQAQLYESNIELENQRNILFNDLEEKPNKLDIKFQKIEEETEKNNEELKNLRSTYVKTMVLFVERQKEHNKHARIRRKAESEYMNKTMIANEMFMAIDENDIKRVQNFVKNDNGKIKQDILSTLTKNGKSEKVPFNTKVLEKATNSRIEIAKKEAELYLDIYEKTKNILEEIENENIKLGKAEKLVRDVGIKLKFLEAEKEYIVIFLDNERMTSINGIKTHEKLMEEACKNFDSDSNQIENLYELIIKETTNQSTKKDYSKLYNKDYLRKIEEKEKDFEEEVIKVKVNIGTVINSNYWRIEGIKNIYKVFQEEVSQKLNRDLSEYKLEEINVEEEQEMSEIIKSATTTTIFTGKKDINNSYDLDDDEGENNDYNELDDELEDYDEHYSHNYKEYKEYVEDIEEDKEDEDDEEYNEDENENIENYIEDDHEDDYENDYENNELDESDEEDNKETQNDEDEKIESYFNVDKYYGFNEEENDIDEEFNEDTIDEIIKNSRKRRNRNRSNKNLEYYNSKSLFGKLFKK